MRDQDTVKIKRVENRDDVHLEVEVEVTSSFDAIGKAKKLFHQQMLNVGEEGE